MRASSSRKALFAGLVYNEIGQVANVAYIGEEPHYVILDEGFRRHVSGEEVDRQVLRWLQEQVFANQELVTQGIMSMLDKDDLFTKAMVDSSVKNIDKLIDQGLPDDARTWLGMMGFKIIVDIHGALVQIEAPNQPADWGGWGPD
jgi:hypothetical protein